MSALFLACLDQRGQMLLPAVLPGLIADSIPVVYLDADFMPHCASCASAPGIRPFITSFDAADPDDFCACCGRPFDVEVCRG